MLAFSQESGIPPGQIARARDLLAGPPIERDSHDSKLDMTRGSM